MAYEAPQSELVSQRARNTAGKKILFFSKIIDNILGLSIAVSIGRSFAAIFVPLLRLVEVGRRGETAGAFQGKYVVTTIELAGILLKLGFSYVIIKLKACRSVSVKCTW
jgi:hypothetical protein